MQLLEVVCVWDCVCECVCVCVRVCLWAERLAQVACWVEALIKWRQINLAPRSDKVVEE
jgi:hypothetical protein